MNEIVKYEPEREFELIQRKAKAYAAADIIPDQFRKNISNVMLVMEYAARVGIAVMPVMQQAYFVGNKMAFQSSFLIATVNSSGKFTPLRFRLEGDPKTDSYGCRAVACDKETGEECIGPLVTVSMARQEGWYSKKGSKWVTMPEVMLHYRAAAFWTRIFAPELSLGMHTVDELADSPQIIGQSSVVRDTPVEPITLDSIATELEEQGEAQPEKPEPAESLDAVAAELFDPAVLQKQNGLIRKSTKGEN